LAQTSRFASASMMASVRARIKSAMPGIIAGGTAPPAANPPAILTISLAECTLL
jgi:hypothetical protein